MGTIDSIKSVLTQSALYASCERFHIPDLVHPELPDHSDKILNSPVGRIGVYSRFFYFANYRVPLSQFLVDILDYFQINLSQLSVIMAVKVVTAVFPLNIPLHRTKSLRKDPHPTPVEFNTDMCNFLADNPALFWKLLEPFLCFIGTKMDLFAFIHHADPTEVNVEEREVMDEEVLLLELTKDRIVSLADSDHVVEVGGIDIIADDEIQAIVAEQPKIKKRMRVADGAVGSGLPPKNSREDHGTSEEAGASVAVKTLAALQGLLDSSTLVAEVGVKAAATVPFVTSFVTPTPEREGGSARDSATETMMRTQGATERFVVLTDSSHHSGTNVADDEVTSIVRSSMPPPSMQTMVVTTTTVVVGTTSALVHDLGTDQVKPSIFRDFASPSMAEVDVVGPSQPVEVEHSSANFYVSHMGSSRQTCFNAEIRMQLEHELRGRQKLEEICVQQVNWLKEKDTEITSLKAQLSLKKAKAVEAIRLPLVEHVAASEAVAVSKDAELASSNSQVSALVTTCSGLRDEVMGYKLFKEQVEEMQDEQVKVLSDHVAAIDSDLIGMALHMDVEFYPCYLKTIAGRRWILIGINHEKAGRGLADVAAFNPSVVSNFVSVVNTLGEVDFPILAQLSSLKDARIMDLMDALRLEGSTAKTPGAAQLQPSLKQLMILIHRLEDQVVIRETSLSFSLEVAHNHVQKIIGDATARRLSLTNAIAPATPVTEAPSLVLSMEAPSPSQIVFEKEDMETMPEHASVE
nr:transposase (putative), gypsy type [Tanacetum cinerariifolium]